MFWYLVLEIIIENQYVIHALSMRWDDYEYDLHGRFIERGSFP